MHSFHSFFKDLNETIQFEHDICRLKTTEENVKLVCNVVEDPSGTIVILYLITSMEWTSQESVSIINLQTFAQDKPKSLKSSLGGSSGESKLQM